MDMSHMLLSNVTVATMNELHNNLNKSNNLINGLLEIIGIYAAEENYKNGLDHTLAFKFLTKLKEDNIISTSPMLSTKPEPINKPKLKAVSSINSNEVA